VRGSNFGIITFIRQRDAGVSIERDCFESFVLGWNSDH